MFLVRNAVRYLAENPTSIQQRRVAWPFALMFVIAMGAAVFYGIFDQQALVALWFGLVGVVCLFLGGFLYASPKNRAVAAYTAWAIGFGSIFGSAAGVFIANLY